MYARFTNLIYKILPRIPRSWHTPRCSISHARTPPLTNKFPVSSRLIRRASSLRCIRAKTFITQQLSAGISSAGYLHISITALARARAIYRDGVFFPRRKFGRAASSSGELSIAVRSAARRCCFTYARRGTIGRASRLIDARRGLAPANNSIANCFAISRDAY